MVQAAVVVNESAIQVIKADGGIRSFIVKIVCSAGFRPRSVFVLIFSPPQTHKCPGLKSAHKNMEMDKCSGPMVTSLLSMLCILMQILQRAKS